MIWRNTTIVNRHNTHHSIVQHYHINMANNSLIHEDVLIRDGEGQDNNAHNAVNDRDQASNGGSEADHIVIHLWSDSFLRSYVAPIDKDWQLTVSKV